MSPSTIANAVRDDRRLLRAAGITGVLAAALSVWADLALQYTRDPSHLLSKQYLYLLDRSPGDLLLGHNLGVFVILLQIAGVWLIQKGLTPAAPVAARIWFGLAASSLAVGAAFHATFAPIGLALHGAVASGLPPDRLADIARQAQPAQMVLATVTLVGLALASLLFSATVLHCPGAFPRWMAAVTPLTFTIVLVLVSRLSPSLRLVLVPCGLNVAETLFFLLATVRLWNLKS